MNLSKLNHFVSKSNILVHQLNLERYDVSKQYLRLMKQKLKKVVSQN